MRKGEVFDLWSSSKIRFFVTGKSTFGLAFLV